ncbi:PLP-dependent aminotransferase family protein [Clostridium septicum]|uniref:MocR-like pyridoxine biosynthesis transcription factor PdxR n=1 Tax=Clostridium septicum TaxID=1504 RepID=UPI003217758B
MDVITINLSNNDNIPLYEQLYNYIKNEIQQGKIVSNTKLPSKRKLAKHLQISLNTIESAYEQLMAEGYIYSKPKKGFFVSELDGVIQIKNSKAYINIDSNKEKVNYKYEFLSSRVDLDSFPYEVWRKISKDIIDIESREFLQIGHSQGELNLREAIAKYLYFSRGVACHPNQIVIGAGTEYLLQVLINIIGRDNSYGMENPGYFKIKRILNTYGIWANGIELDNYGVNIEKLNESSVNIMHITPSHQFPLGIVMPIKRRMQLLTWANEGENRYIIEDDYDSEFRFGGKPIPALQSLDNNGRVIYLGTFSKCLAPSMRIGYMVLPESLLEKYKKQFSFYACTVSRLDQQILFKFIEKDYFEKHLNKMRNIYKKRREKLVSLIKNHLNYTEIIGTNAGLHLLLKVNNGMVESELIKNAKNKGVKVLGLSNSYMNREECEKKATIFLGYASLREEELEDAILLLKSAWE